jgi:radical SAM superfamily enzyme YgiQ (UPF0313 family)
VLSLKKLSVEEQNVPRELDVLIIHPVVTRRGRALHVITPVGLFNLASQLKKENFSTEIVNLGVERLLDPSFRLDEYIKKRNPKIVGVDLHWYPHSYVSIEVARKVKECSEALVVMGGYTASCFDVEILRSFPSIDVILRGDAEYPLKELAKKYLRGEDYTNTANSTVKKGGRIYKNPITYVTENLDEFSFDGLNLMRHWEDYLSVKLIWNPAPYAVLDSKAQKSVDLCISRGCYYQCSYCGGGKEAQSILCERKGLCFKSPEKIVEDILFLEEKGIENIRMAYVGYPHDQKFYLNLLKLVRQEKADVSCNISLWNLPSEEILSSVHKSFNSVSADISPDSGSETVRKLNKGPYYDNHQLSKTLKSLEKKDASVDMYFIIGLPGETKADFEMTLKLAKSLKQLRKNVKNVYCYGVTAEPGSPIHRTPENFGVKVHRKSFLDFYEFWRKMEKGKEAKNLLGLERLEFSEYQIIEMIKRFRSEMNENCESKGT